MTLGLGLACAAAPSRPASPALAAQARALYRARYAPRMVPLVSELVAFPTVAGRPEALQGQRQALARMAGELGLRFRDAGLVSEIDLPGPEGAPVLGLVTHGDVQPVDPGEWTSAPFQPTVAGAVLRGRGVADDKGPVVQALLALAALRDAGPARTHTVRLLVGSDEESGSQDIKAYLAENQPPLLSLVLDSAFPVVVGEKAWNALAVVAADPYRVRPAPALPPLWIAALEAGLAPSIVPSRASAELRVADGGPGAEAVGALHRLAVPEGYRLEVLEAPGRVTVTVHGRAAHAGVNLSGGRNALVLLGRLLAGRTAPSGAADLLAFAAHAGQDLHGAGLGLAAADPAWAYDVNVATVKAEAAGQLVLTVNVRSGPGPAGAELKRLLDGEVTAFAARTGAQLTPGPGWYGDGPLVFDPQAEVVQRLLAAYQRGAGEDAPPAISGGGTYAKRLPRSIAFGMWFPGKPYPGHDADEQIAVEDLHRGVDVLLEALADLACSPPLERPFSRRNSPAAPP